MANHQRNQRPARSQPKVLVLPSLSSRFSQGVLAMISPVLVLFTHAHRLVKAEAGNLKSDFTLRRFNVDISKGAHRDVIQYVQH